MDPLNIYFMLCYKFLLGQGCGFWFQPNTLSYRRRAWAPGGHELFRRNLKPKFEN